MDKQYCNPEIWGGIECTINRVRNEYFDQLDYSGHYNRPGDIEKIAELGITKLRYPLLWEKHQPSLEADIDWTWSENQLSKIRELNVDVIAGLVHHGSGPAFTRLDDPEFPTLLANYARLVAEKFPWINYYTPVNEPLTTARFSGLYGIWFPHHNNARSFLKMLLNELKGTVLAMQEIRKINPDARLVQTEDLGKTYSIPSLAYQARFENQRRWLTFDILCGRFNEQHPLWKYCNQFSIPKEDFQFFLDNPCVPDIFGFNHYLTSERYLDTNLQAYPPHTHGGNGRDHYADVEAVRVELEEPMGLEVLLQEAWERYKQPMAITEVHLHSHREEQLRWFRQVWDTARKLGSEKINLQAVTSWAMLGSYGWNNLLREPYGDYEPGAFDLRGGDLRPTALANFIKETAKTNQCSHPLSHEQGWWRRSSRLIYQPSMAQVRIRPGKNQPILIIGRNGTLGKAFARICEERFLDYRLLGRDECDISSSPSIEEAIDHHRPWAVINAAGFVRVDDAEHEKEACFRDNTRGPQLLAEACQTKGIRLLSFSSDLVFDGLKLGAYVETDPVNPLNIYGSSKAEAEKLVRLACPSALMVRTSAFFGPWDEYNFLSYVRKSLSQYQPINVAGNILISPTYVPDLVHASLDLLIDEVEGIWHMANRGQISWSELAHEVASNFDLDRGLIQSLTNEEMNYTAPRPDNSVLTSERGQLLPTLEEALGRYFHGQKRTQRKVA
jgi:dTDP-4-dehydrorhamnose reductase